MKVLSWFLTPKTKRLNLKRFIFSPYLSPRSLAYSAPNRLGSLISTFIIFSILLLVSIALMKYYLNPATIWKILLISPMMYFTTEFIGITGQLLFYKNTPDSFPIHKSPFASRDLSQFWGRHWNLWVQDLFKDLSYGFRRGSKHQKMLGIFLVSGTIHELQVNLPYWLIYHKSYFGTMMAYFLIQAAGLGFEKRFMRKTHPYLKKVYAFMVVVLPSPLFINVPFLKLLGITYG